VNHAGAVSVTLSERRARRRRRAARSESKRVHRGASTSFRRPSYVRAPPVAQPDGLAAEMGLDPKQLDSVGMRPLCHHCQPPSCRATAPSIGSVQWDRRRSRGHL